MTHLPAWKEINALFERHGLAAPPTRLRDELVTHLLAYRATLSSEEQPIGAEGTDAAALPGMNQEDGPA